MFRKTLQERLINMIYENGNSRKGMNRISHIIKTVSILK